MQRTYFRDDPLNTAEIVVLERINSEWKFDIVPAYSKSKSDLLHLKALAPKYVTEDRIFIEDSPERKKAESDIFIRPSGKVILENPEPQNEWLSRVLTDDGTSYVRPFIGIAKNIRVLLFLLKMTWVGKISYLFTFFDPLDLTLYDSLTNGFLEIGKRIINFHYLTDFLAVTNGALLFNSSIVLDGFSTSEDSFDFSQPVSIIRDNKKQMFSVPSFYIYIGVCFLSSSSNGFFYLNSENGEVYLYKNESRSGIIVKKWSSFRELLDYIHASATWIIKVIMEC